MAKIIGLSVEKEISGIYHWGDAEFVSRYEFAKMIAKHYNLKTELISPKSTEELGQVARDQIRLTIREIVKVRNPNNPL